MKRVLSLDGGGIRGVITAEMLANLQDNLDKPLHEYFDIIVGSSTGAILALAVASGKFKAGELPNLYLEHGKKIFEKKWWRKGITRPKYDGRGLDRVLQNEFNGLSLGHTKAPVLITGYSVTTTQAIMFKNWKPEHSKLRMWEVARASAAAPTFFPAKKIRIAGKTHSVIDGGVVMNNPALCGASELLKLGHNPLNIHVVSIGTGEQVSAISHSSAHKWGLGRWAKPLIPILFDGDSDAVNYVGRHTFGRFDRYQVTGLPERLRAMDEWKNATALRSFAFPFDEKMYKLAQRLQND